MFQFKSKTDDSISSRKLKKLFLFSILFYPNNDYSSIKKIWFLNDIYIKWLPFLFFFFIKIYSWDYYKDEKQQQQIALIWAVYCYNNLI